MSTAATGVATLEESEAQTISRVRSLWTAMKRKPLGAVSAALLVVLVLTAVFADVLAPYDPLAAHPEIRLSAPSRAHLFGTDDIEVRVSNPGRLGRRPYRGGIINEQGSRAQYMYAFEVRSTGGQADAFLQYSKALQADLEVGPLPARFP